jgi:hypothetical protein
VAEALADLLLNPRRRLLLRWNWKTALLSACARGTIFFFANLGAGLGAAIGAMGVEAALFATLAGFYGALAQAFRRAQPAWAATMTLMALAPAVNHTLEYLMHYANGTKRIAAGVVASISLSILSALFNLFAMRRGVLIVGDEKASLTDDLRRMPRVVFDFVMTIPRALWRMRISHRATETQRRRREKERLS